MAGYAKLFAAAALAVALPAISACKQEAGDKTAEAPADDKDLVDVGAHMQLSASEALQEAMKDTFEPAQVSLLEGVAHQMAVANYCDGFDLDKDKAKAEMAKVGKGKEGSEVDPDTAKQQLSVAFGMAIGSQMAVAANDPQAFCDNARDEKPEDASKEDGYILTSSS